MIHATCEQEKSYPVKKYLDFKVPYRCSSFSSVAFDPVPCATSGSGAEVEPMRLLLGTVKRGTPLYSSTQMASTNGSSPSPQNNDFHKPPGSLFHLRHTDSKLNQVH